MDRGYLAILAVSTNHYLEGNGCPPFVFKLCKLPWKRNSKTLTASQKIDPDVSLLVLKSFQNVPMKLHLHQFTSHLPTPTRVTRRGPTFTVLTWCSYNVERCDSSSTVCANCGGDQH